MRRGGFMSASSEVSSLKSCTSGHVELRTPKTGVDVRQKKPASHGQVDRPVSEAVTAIVTSTYLG